MSNASRDFFATPIPKTVWHYTSLAALEGILTSGRVWATEAHHTSDTTEFVHLRTVANKFLADLQPISVPAQEAKRAAMSIVEMAFTTGPLSPASVEVFIASFSSACDLKSQWLAYADRGHGVSIAFDFCDIRPEPGESAVTFAPCIYDQETQEVLLKKALTHIMQVVEGIHERTSSEVWVATQIDGWNRVDQLFGVVSSGFERKKVAAEEFAKEIRPAAVRSTFELLRLASHCKHAAYFEEKEWRLAMPHKKGQAMTQDTIEYRNGLSPIPYVAHKIGTDKLPITSVMLGPFSEDRDTVEALLVKYGYSIPVTQSTLPVRRAL